MVSKAQPERLCIQVAINSQASLSFPELGTEEPHGHPAETTRFVSPQLPMCDCSLTLTLNSQHPWHLGCPSWFYLHLRCPPGIGLACPMLGDDLLQKTYCCFLGSSLSCRCVYMVCWCVCIIPNCEQLEGRVYYIHLCIPRAWRVKSLTECMFD